MNPLEERLLASKVVVCVGAGGVGKTTVSASVALQAARRGKKAIVLTIDPAKRLANALGLERLGNRETRVDPPGGLPEGGELWAMMLDLKRSWDDFIVRNVAPERHEAIFGNRFYRTLSSALAGSQEYIATEKLYELHSSGRYDLLVLDTPPTANALDFLDAPRRILDFLGNDALRALLTPAVAAGRFGLRLFQVGGHAVMKGLSKVTGVEALQELASFLGEMQDTYEVFKDRAGKVRALLSSDEAAFLLVTSAQGNPTDEAIHFHRLLREAEMTVAAVVTNRVHEDPLGDLPLPTADQLADALLRDGVEDGGAPPLSTRLHQTLEEAHALATLDRRHGDKLRAATHPTPQVHIPRFPSDVYDFPGLTAVAHHLFPRS